MEEKKPGRVKRVAKTFVDVPNWMGASWINDQWSIISKTFKNIYLPSAQSQYKETFEAAMLRLHLSEKDLQNRVHEFSRLFYFCAALALLAFSYAVYLLFDGSIRACFVSLAITFMLSAQAFRYHFWRFQILSRRLGCTFSDWLKYTFSLKTKSTGLRK